MSATVTRHIAELGLYVEVVAVLATTSALDCARERPSSSPPEVMPGAIVAAGKAAVSACSKLLVMLILFIEFLKQVPRMRWR